MFAFLFICSLFQNIVSFKLFYHSTNPLVQKHSSSCISFDDSSSLKLSINNQIDDEEELGMQKGDFKSGFVSILGNPNVGKSTLMNALLGEPLCIVSPKPQTTRHRILGVYSKPNYQIVFSDTPGMVEPAYLLQESMMDSVKGAYGDADVIVLVTDVYGDQLVDSKIFDKLVSSTRPIIIAVNKVDLIDTNTTIRNYLNQNDGSSSFSPPVMTDTPIIEEEVKKEHISQASLLRRKIFERKKNKRDDVITPKSILQLTKLWQERLPRAAVVGLCAQNGTGIESLLDKIVSYLPQGPKYFPSDTLTNRDERFFTAEIIREAILNIYQDEIPYSCEVIIDSFKDRSPTLSAIECIIMTNRPTQKSIIIGKNGMKLKELGILARQKLEKFLDRKVFLSFRVEADPDWRSNKESLVKYGYIDSDFG